MNCSICKDPILSADLLKTCGKCLSEFHIECWEQNLGCGTPGCSNVPDVNDENEELKETDTFWGITKKNCPACKEEIDIRSMVCPFCRETFDSIAPTTEDDLRNKVSVTRTKIKENKGAMWIFVCGIIGFTAPINLIIGGIWYFYNKRILKEKSPVYYILAIFGLSFSGLFMILFFLLLIAS
jgi:hypothetical protein